MWIYMHNGSMAFNMEHMTRLYIEETGSGAALKADIDGKTVMIGYYASKAEAHAALSNVMAKRSDNVAVITV
jgi:hypothetical protein